MNANQVLGIQLQREAAHVATCNTSHHSSEPCARQVPETPQADPRVAMLDSLVPGTRVADATHDLWVKQENGTWSCLYVDDPYCLTAESLLHVWGPVTVIPKEGM